MPTHRRDVTDAELAVLEVLWTRQQATIRDIVDELYPGGSTSDYATVQKLLERLADKRCVTRSRRRVPHVFAPRVARADLIGLRLQDLADRLCQGSVTPLLTSLLERRDLSRGEIDELRALVETLDRDRQQRKESR